MATLPEFIHAAGEPTEIKATACGEAVEWIEAADGEEKAALKRFSMTAYTGDQMNVAGFYHPVVIDLAGLDSSKQNRPIFKNHDESQIVGHTDKIDVSASRVKASGVISGAGNHVDEVRALAANGFPWQASVGVAVKNREFVPAGEKVKVNGRNFAGPVIVVRAGTLKEISFVPLGADDSTSAAVAAGRYGGSAMNEYEKWLQAKGIDPASISEEVNSALKASFDAEQKAKQPPAPPAPAPAAPPVQATSLDQIVEAQRAEDARVDQITKIAAEHINKRPLMLDEIEKMARAAIASKSKPDEFELAVLRAARPSGPGIVSRGDSKAGAKVVEAALCLAGGLKNPEKQGYDDATLNAASDRFPHGLGLVDVLAMVARENGYSGNTSRDVRALLEAAFRPQVGLKASGFSSLSLPGILSNVANKFLLAGFMAVESTWREIAAIRAVKDFKTATSYSLTGGFQYEKVGPGGELKHADVGELSYTNKAETYGRMFAITRTDIINDDLGALTAVPQRLGRGAALKLNDVFWTLFLNNSSFFTSGRGNAFTGATPGATTDSRLNTDGLTRAEVGFLNQTDADGYPVGIMPEILLVPNALSVAANQLMVSTELRDTTANTLFVTTNPHAGKFRIARSSYMSNSAYTGYSTTAWYLLASPSNVATVEVAFLNGRQEPTVESADADFNVLGIQMRGYHDFGVAFQEYRGGVRMAGA